ncbi:MAG: DUF721 domain-containing protein [Candidatus Omnitrophica bacterium]|nr:DUF721 domain-containing protein [Candidatus Omnitrophota bacterium]
MKLQDPEAQRRQKLILEWPSIAGPKIAPHTKPSLGKNGSLYVWVDQSTLAFELNQRYRQNLLKRTQAVLGEENVNKIYFRVGQIR